MITALHGIHRKTYMSEKQAYYENRILGEEVYPDKYMSIIADGMSSNHTQFPQHGEEEFDLIRKKIPKRN